MSHREKWWEPKTGLARYAYGYTNKKPHWTEWAVYVALVVGTVFLALVRFR